MHLQSKDRTPVTPSWQVRPGGTNPCDPLSAQFFAWYFLCWCLFRSERDLAYFFENMINGAILKKKLAKKCKKIHFRYHRLQFNLCVGFPIFPTSKRLIFFPIMMLTAVCQQFGLWTVSPGNRRWQGKFLFWGRERERESQPFLIDVIYGIAYQSI